MSAGRGVKSSCWRIGPTIQSCGRGQHEWEQGRVWAIHIHGRGRDGDRQRCACMKAQRCGHQSAAVRDKMHRKTYSAATWRKRGLTCTNISAQTWCYLWIKKTFASVTAALTAHPVLAFQKQWIPQMSRQLSRPLSRLRRKWSVVHVRKKPLTGQGSPPLSSGKYQPSIQIIIVRCITRHLCMFPLGGLPRSGILHP